MSLISSKSTVLGAALLLAAVPAHAEKSFKLDNAMQYAPTATIGVANQHFADLVREKTKGTVDITCHFGGALGYTSREGYDAVEEGGVDMTSFAFDNLVGLHPVYNVHSLPFVARTFDEAWVLYQVARPYHDKALKEANQILLMSAPWSPWGLWAKHPIKKYEDIKGLKMRTPDSTSVEVFKAVNAAPVRLSWGEVAPGLSTNAIEGVLTADESGVVGKFWEFGVNVFNAFGYTEPVSGTTININVWESLSDSQRQAMIEAGKEAEAAAWKAAVERQKKNVQTLEAAGGTFFTDLPEDLIADLRKAGQGVVDKWLKDMGGDGEKILAKYNEMKKK